MAGRLDDADWLARECETRSARSIARELGVAPDTVLRAMRIHDIPVRFATSQRRPPRAELDDPAWLAERHDRMTPGSIADELGVAEATVNEPSSCTALSSAIVLRVSGFGRAGAERPGVACGAVRDEAGVARYPERSDPRSDPDGPLDVGPSRARHDHWRNVSLRGMPAGHRWRRSAPSGGGRWMSPQGRRPETFGR
jgi:hypothetical protein